MSKEEIDEYTLQLTSVEQALENDPDNASLKELRTELKDLLALLKDSSPPPTVTGSANHGENENKKYEVSTKPFENSVAGDDVASYKKSVAQNPKIVEDRSRSPPRNVFKLGMTVEARWLSGDKQFHPAKITGVTGHRDHPMFTVRFLSANKMSETVPSNCVRHSSKHSGSASPVGLSSSSPRPDDRAIERSKRKEAYNDSPLGEQQAPPRKISKAKQQAKKLDDTQMKWQAFANKGIKTSRGMKPKKLGENSMFQTPEGIGGRVGIVGSGKPMRKGTVRGRHIYKGGPNDQD